MSLEWLDIQYNEIEELGNYYKLKSGFNLKRLDASGNLIQSLNKLSLPMSLEIIGKSEVVFNEKKKNCHAKLFLKKQDKPF